MSKEKEALVKSLEFDRETLTKITDPLLENEEIAEKFVNNYKKLRRMFELLGAHPKKLKYQEEFAALTEIYYAYLHRRRDFEDIENYVKKYFPKTLEIIHKLINLGRINEVFPIIKLEESYLRKLEDAYPDVSQRVFNMLFDLRKFVYVEKSRTPYLETIGERVDKIMREIRERKIKIEEAYEKLKQLVMEVNEVQQSRRQFNERELSILLPLWEHVGKTPKLTDEAKKLMKDLEAEGAFFPGWNQKTETIRKVGLKVRSFLRKLKLTFEQRNKLFDKIMDSLTKVG